MNVISKIADNKKIGFSFITVIIAIFISILSGDGGVLSFFVAMISGILLAVGFSFWNVRKFKSIFFESLKITFGITCFVYIMGYSYYALESIILK